MPLFTFFNAILRNVLVQIASKVGLQENIVMRASDKAPVK
jgi:hypothetical protein